MQPCHPGKSSLVIEHLKHVEDNFEEVIRTRWESEGISIKDRIKQQEKCQQLFKKFLNNLPPEKSGHVSERDLPELCLWFQRHINEELIIPFFGAPIYVEYCYLKQEWEKNV